MRKIIYALCCLMAVVCMAVSCKKNHTYDYTYSPSAPKAGQTVTFTNISDAGESWLWQFGDGGKSTLKNPTHIFTSAGSYVVELMADSNKSRKISHVLEVLDSIPSIHIASDSIQQYTPVTMTVSLYNPSKADVTCLWELDETIFTFIYGDLTSDSIIGYYSAYDRTTEVKLTVTVGDKTTEDQRTLTLLDNPAPSLFMQTQTGELWRQRIYSGVFEYAQPYDEDASVIESANDSTAVLNGVTYDVNNMSVLTDENVLALQVDAINRKLYVILDDGLYVANANGDNLAQIWDIPAATLLVDVESNSLFWSDAYGVWTMSLVTHPQNIISDQIKARITNVNEVSVVNRMVIK